MNTRSPAPTRRLRIAVLNRTFSPTGGGAERYSIALVEALAQRHDIHVFAQHIQHAWPGVSYHPVFLPFARPRWINQLWFALATWWATRRGFDVVHSHENTWHGQVQTVHVVPVKYSLFHHVTGWRKGLRWLKVMTSPRLLTYLALEYFRYAADQGRCVVVTSDSLKAVMASAYPATATVVVPPGVARIADPVDADTRRQARVALGLPLEGRCVLFVGNDYRKKGLPTLVEALRTLPKDCYVVVVGNAAQIPAFRAAFLHSDTAERVHFVGALNDVDVAYRAADCLAHPTLEDTFAMVVLEALAHGLPVVVSSARFCGIAGSLRDGQNALILDDPQDAQALAAALVRVLDDADTRQRLCRGGVCFAQTCLWSQIALEQDRIYAAVALCTPPSGL